MSKILIDKTNLLEKTKEVGQRAENIDRFMGQMDIVNLILEAPEIEILEEE